MLVRPVDVPPSHLQLGGDSRITAESAGPVGHAKEPSHVLSSGFWVIIWIRRPGPASLHHVPGRFQVSEWSESEAVPHHAKRSSEHSRPVAAVVPSPGVTFAATNRDRIECESRPSPWHGPILPHRIV
jgi:hypothetical protein